MQLTIEEAREFERKYSLLATLELEKIFKYLYKNSTVSVSCNIGPDKEEIEKQLSIDATVSVSNIPNSTIQLKGRSYEGLEYFREHQTIPISIRKIFPNGKMYDGDYYKCNASYYMYLFPNKGFTKLLYWVLFDWKKLSEIFKQARGWDHVPGVKYIPFDKDKSNILTHAISVPIKLLEKKECLIIDSDTMYSVNTQV